MLKHYTVYGETNSLFIANTNISFTIKTIKEDQLHANSALWSTVANQPSINMSRQS